MARFRRGGGLDEGEYFQTPITMTNCAAAGHGAELPYVFQYPFGAPWNTDQKEMGRKIAAYGLLMDTYMNAKRSAVSINHSNK